VPVRDGTVVGDGVVSLLHPARASPTAIAVARMSRFERWCISARILSRQIILYWDRQCRIRQEFFVRETLQKRDDIPSNPIALESSPEAADCVGGDRIRSVRMLPSCM
jgi:hypothetical protein